MSDGIAPLARADAYVLGTGVVTRQNMRWYPPALVALGVTSWLAWRGIIVLQHTGGIGRTVDSTRRQLIGPTVLGFLVLVMGAERLWPAVRRPLLARGHVQDGIYSSCTPWRWCPSSSSSVSGSPTR